MNAAILCRKNSRGENKNVGLSDWIVGWRDYRGSSRGGRIPADHGDGVWRKRTKGVMAMEEVFAVYADKAGNKIMIQKQYGQYQAAKVSADGNRMRRIRSIRRCDRANEMQDLIDKYADSNGFRYVGRLKADELEMDW